MTGLSPTEVIDLPPGARPIMDFDDARAVILGYCVRDDGTVLWWYARGKRWVTSKVKTGPGGFRKVRLVIDGKVREIGIAQLVLRAFIGPRPLGHEPLHFPDTNPGNNRLDNLRWAPIGSAKIGRMTSGSPPVALRGERSKNAVLTEADIPEIRRLYRAGWKYKEIAHDLGVAEETVRHVLIGRTWTHIPDPDGPIVMARRGPQSDEAGKAKLDWASVRAVRAGHSAGKSYAELAREFGVAKPTIAGIVKGRQWKEMER